ncbi:hypothetical protein LJB88_05125 [Erysipelotrichaceae bacterium OttesenSCG-928-M19]|nr:hypothetical protein [Erysipelotrichaceae bacterium OttesenSCG-928-M19]
MKKYYDDFTKLPVSKMADKIAEMTYLYKHTEVPKTHYKKILDENIIELLATDNTMQLVLLNAVTNQLKSLKDESPELFFKSLLALQLDIKIDKITSREFDSINNTYQVYKDELFISNDIKERYEYEYQHHCEQDYEYDDEIEYSLTFSKTTKSSN